MPAHVKQAMIGATVAVPVENGVMSCGSGLAQGSKNVAYQHQPHATDQLRNTPHLWEHRNMRPGGQREVTYVLHAGASVLRQDRLTLQMENGKAECWMSNGRSCWTAQPCLDVVNSFLWEACAAEMSGHETGKGISCDGTLHVYVATPMASIVVVPAPAMGPERLAAAVQHAVKGLMSCASGADMDAAETGAVAALGASVTLPVRNGRLALSDAQSLVLAALCPRASPASSMMASTLAWPSVELILTLQGVRDDN